MAGGQCLETHESSSCPSSNAGPDPKLRIPEPAAVAGQSRYDRHHKCASTASTARSVDTLRSSNSIDIEKDAARSELYPSSFLESPRLETGHSPFQTDNQLDPIPVKYEYYKDSEFSAAPQDKAFKMLLFFCTLLPVHCLGVLLWTLLALLYSILSQPYRSLTGRPAFPNHLLSLLCPSHRFQAACIYSPAHEGPYILSRLLAASVLSPFLSLGMAVAGCVVALFWACSAIVGNPDGAESRNDGRELVMILRRWWHGWLMAAIRH